MDTHDTARFNWTVHQYDRHERSADWYWILGILAVVGIAISIIFKNYLLAILIALGSLIIGVLAGRDHPEITVSITGKGILVNTTLFSYKKIKSFWIYKTSSPSGAQYRMILEVARPMLPFFTLPISETTDTQELRAFLRTRILEKEHREPAIDGIMRNLKI